MASVADVFSQARKAFIFGSVDFDSDFLIVWVQIGLERPTTDRNQRQNIHNIINNPQIRSLYHASVSPNCNPSVGTVNSTPVSESNGVSSS